MLTEPIHHSLIDVDDFIANLWKVHLAVKSEGYAHSLSLGLFRSDYMLDTPPDHTSPSLKQVEFNTISSSFGGLSSLITSLHTHLIEQPPDYPIHPLLTSNPPPENTAIPSLVAGLAAAHTAYGPSKTFPPHPLCIIFIVQDYERNIFDQLHLSTHLTAHHKIPVFRLPISQILTSTTIHTHNNHRPLTYNPPHSPQMHFEVSTVYLRALYAPTDYTSPTSWTARTHLERSAAIKCPTVLTQLAGCKKIQQVLTSTSPDHLSHFLPNTPHSMKEQIRGTFAPHYDLSTQGRGRELALDPSTAANHVLKPQREGGGNNIYKTNIPTFLRSIPEADWKRWVLMKLIYPPAEAKNAVLRSDGAVVSGGTISELGIFGTILWDERGKILQNEEAGWLLRTKGKESDEGGVAAGFSCLDSLVLVDEDWRLLDR